MAEIDNDPELKFEEIKQQVEILRRMELSREQRDRIAEWTCGLIAIVEEIAKGKIICSTESQRK